MIPLVIIAGPTASGKTALSVELALRLGGEIVSADSMQIYKNMDIGTAKPTPEEKKGVPHHLMDIVSPDEKFSLSEYVKLAHKTIEDIYSRGKLPIMVGGTGLYIDTVISNTLLSDAGIDEEYRKNLEEYAKINGNALLKEKLKDVDEESYNRLHENDVKRIIRALEIHHLTGKTIGEYNRESKNTPRIYNTVGFIINHDRETLYNRINERVDIMISSGLLDEVKNCIKMGLNKKSTAMQAIGYKEMAEYLNGEIAFEEAVEKIKMESRRYAKRQITWFKRGNYNLLEPEELGVLADKAEEIIREVIR